MKNIDNKLLLSQVSAGAVVCRPSGQTYPAVICENIEEFTNSAPDLSRDDLNCLNNIGINAIQTGAAGWVAGGPAGAFLGATAGAAAGSVTGGCWLPPEDK